MIYTVTLNPSLDYTMKVPELHMGRTNRSVEEKLMPGGKGINVSLMLQNLGLASTALGFLAGFTGEEIGRAVQECGIQEQFLLLEEGQSRINVKLRADVETEINGSGPEIPAEKLEELKRQILLLQAEDILVLSGSLPPSVPKDYYCRLMDGCEGKGILTVADTQGEGLLAVLSCHPFLIKPNHHELNEIFGKEITEKEELFSCALSLQRQGARNILISRAEKGALMLTEDGRWLEQKAPEGILVNSVGAGDSMIAGFLAGWLEQEEYNTALGMAVAAGSASAFCEGFASREQVLALYPGRKGTGE